MILPLAQVKTIIRDLPVFDGTPSYFTADSYWLPSNKFFKEVLAPTVQAEFKRLPAATNRRDCTQAVLIARALAANAMGKRTENAGIAVGRTIGGLYSPINGIYPSSPGTMHDTCIIIFSDDITPYFYEPQNGFVTRADAVSLGDWAASLVEL